MSDIREKLSALYLNLTQPHGKYRSVDELAAKIGVLADGLVAGQPANVDLTKEQFVTLIASFMANGRFSLEEVATRLAPHRGVPFSSLKI